MSETYTIREKLVEIARRDVGKKEVSKNRASWIAKLWTATNYGDGLKDRAPYCAAGMAYCLREWGKLVETRDALGMSAAEFEKWRCKSASVFNAPKHNWVQWAKDKKLMFVPVTGIFHAGDLVVFKFSHIEMYVTDDATLSKNGILDIGYNTDDAASREGDGCFEKPRTRAKILHVIRMLH